ncbi:MAG: ABC transporter ATP-binding protein [Nitrospinae bacterium]|nr:ABC transporter ATP-binding protein [Nitrospinota bacterium]
MENAVEVIGLTKKFGDFTAVNNISLSVGKGEIFGFLGPNGAGKSTTIKMLCGLLNPTAGAGRVGGLDVATQSEEIKKNIGYMSQRFSLYDDLTVEQNINFFMGIYNVPKSRASARKQMALEMAGLGGGGKTLTRNLPGGIKQRLALGCAILHEPPIIFLDEPTSGVDPVSRRNFWSLIYTMAEGGATVFVTTHYMEEAEYCGRLALIYRGGIIAEGSPEELKTKYMKRRVIEVEVDRPIEAMEALEEAGMEAAIFGSMIHLTVDEAAGDGDNARSVLTANGFAVKGIANIAPSLEDVFVSLIEVA